MNWKEIKEKYTRPFEIFQNWLKQNGWWFNPIDKTIRSDFGRWPSGRNYRILYDFFDEQGIHIGIEVYRRDTIMEAYYFVFDVYEKKADDYFTDNICYPDRKDCEEAAFMKAFEILEEQL